MKTIAELLAAGFRNTLGFRFGSSVDVYTREEKDGSTTVVLRDVTTGEVTEPFHPQAARTI